MKIAIIGSAPSSVGLAPYDDPSWEIWGCSSGAAPFARRVSAWFELHHYGPGDPRQYMHTPEYVKFLRELKQPVHMIRHYEDIPSSVPYPKAEVQAEFGEYFFTSSIAWMTALAIQQKPTEIGFWGIDMAARDEYGYQRAGLHHFITLARMRGISITVPAESDLLRPEPQYGCREPSPMAIKMMTRKKELEARLNGLQAHYDAMFREMLFLRGALDDLDYWQTIWSDQDPKSIAGG
jgi:hypothetical protein